MSKIAREIVVWNRFVRALATAERHWKELGLIMAEQNRSEVQRLSPAAQRFLSKGFVKAKFDIMLPRIVDYWRSIGGLKELLIPTKEERNDGGS